MTIKKFNKLAIFMMILMFTVISSVNSFEIKPSIFEKSIAEINQPILLNNENDNFSSGGEFNAVSNNNKKLQGYKSPGKAFLLSLAVPGLGQYYYGSKVKPFIFFGAEVASWVLHASWHSDGNEITRQFEAIADNHWIQADYESYLMTAYGVSDDDSVTAQEVSHHLPDTKTQQYYEVIGKYDQFSWGWDDAMLITNNGADTAFVPTQAVIGDGTIPYSETRVQYEQLRHDANNKFNNANKMIIVSIANHLISAFEAYFVTKSRNNNLRKSNSTFGRVKVKTDLKSYSETLDTPYLEVTLKF